MDPHHFQVGTWVKRVASEPPKPTRRPVPNKKKDPAGEGYGSLYASDFTPQAGVGIWNNPRRWEGIRNMFSDKPRLPHQKFAAKLSKAAVLYAEPSSTWTTDYRQNIGQFTNAEGLKEKRRKCFLGQGKGSQAFEEDKVGFSSSKNWTSDYRQGPGSSKTREMTAKAKREPPEAFKSKLPPYYERIHPHWADVKDNPYATGYKGWLASDYQEGSGHRDEPKIYRATRHSKDEYRYIRGCFHYPIKPLVGY
mmetsp:Transcript_3234/g.7616  ORF Transcript_3234/g.7616 Transcript_3234/m.7616 type:complete len:250 (-) Transcript_3234:388-1137(-)|eukprot:CAMPEP_0178982104 /NCGR_PEP_ID=MMETSP0795-20121207/314_1 /TAXON_ID=88552 /ORGANISM="Amoebophrya sp., Strain Ameob2" /LENGTH=249 /DNA_ID=CAMNT_0020672719 /DNA_START=106 /DNA_END=855 /DNA_ORIENTATION=-